MVTTEPATRELRYASAPLRGLELRESEGGGDGLIITGYAAVTEQETTLYDGRYLQLNEVVARGAFAPVLGRAGLDVHLNIGHDMTRAIARTGVNGVGRLELTEDERGLRVFARVDPADPDVMSLEPKMRAGIVDQMSFAFTVAEDEAMVRDDDGREVELQVDGGFIQWRYEDDLVWTDLIAVDDLTGPAIAALLQEHVDQMRANTIDKQAGSESLIIGWAGIPIVELRQP